MESAETPPRLRALGEELQPLRKVRWLGRLRRWSEREQGGDAVSYSGNEERGDDPGRFDVPEPTRVFGAYAEALQPNQPPAGPSQAEIDNRPLIEAAMAVKDPWAGETPPLYSSRATRK